MRWRECLSRSEAAEKSRLAACGLASVFVVALGLAGPARAQLGQIASPAASAETSADPSRTAIAEPEGPLNGVYEGGVVELAPSASEFHSLVIDNRLGNVRVEGYDGDSVVVQAMKRAPDSAALERLKVTLVPDPSGVLRVGTRVASDGEVRRLAAGAVRIDLVIRAPRSASVEARVWNGALEVRGMENGAELRANEGNIDVTSSSGRFVTSSTKGRQRLHEIVGEIDARGLLGEVALDMVRGRRLAARLHEGRVSARRIRTRHVEVRVTRGDIDFQGEPRVGGSWSIITYKGNINVSFARRTSFTVKARARRGTVSLPPGIKAARKDGSGWIRGAHAGHTAAASTATLEIAANIGNVSLRF